MGIGHWEWECGVWGNVGRGWEVWGSMGKEFCLILPHTLHPTPYTLPTYT
ncbi:MAG: hypothetical protein F6J93_25065 [Oscillatoria sp. SIO1A7]|nr:hypothetical protein [Oscillatoria sp. SIO1A7]